MKRLIFNIVFIAFYIVSFSSPITPVAWEKGNGTEKKPYLIESAEHLYYLSTQVNNGNSYENTYFCLSNNIDLRGNKDNQWKAIGTVGRPFKGHFNGNHFEIINLFMEDHSSDYTGLFGYVHLGTIENTGISELGFIAGKDNTGGIVGYQMGGTVFNCYNKAPVHGQNNVGGIAGYQYSVTVKSCYNSGTIRGKWHVGGIMGIGYARTHLYNCFNTGNIYGDNYVGGIVGKIDGYNQKASLNNCYQESIFEKTGLIGTGISVECFNCYYTDVPGMQRDKYGTPLTNEDMTSDSFLTKLNNTGNIWIQDKKPYINSGYPIIASIKYKGIFTNEAIDIEEETAVLQGNFIGRDETVLRRGFEYKIKDSAQFMTVFVDTESFSYQLTKLKPNTAYEFMAFVMTNKGKITGRKIEFHTLDNHHHHHDHEHHHILKHTP
jgi:hypothetical protein